MKKLKLKMLSLGTMEVLTREQLKNVVAGDGSGGAGGCFTSNCWYCCTADLRLCGACTTKGNISNGCQGSGGIALSCQGY